MAACVANGPTSGLGNGSEVDPNVLAGTTTINQTRTTVTGVSGSDTLVVGSPVGFAVGNIVLLHQSRGTGAGAWEFGRVTSTVPFKLSLPAQNTYVLPGAQMVRVHQYAAVTVAAGATLTAPAWDGTTGGLVAFLSTGAVNIAGTLSASGLGFRGGAGDGGGSVCGSGIQGESPLGLGIASTAANGGGGGGGGAGINCCGGCNIPSGSPAGGSAGYATAGIAGTGGGTPGAAGTTYGAAALTSLFFGAGGGGGGGNCGASSPPGGNGGGAIYVAANSITVSGAGSIVAKGVQSSPDIPGNWEGSSGGGAGGSIVLAANTATVVASSINAQGGPGTNVCSVAGLGGDGRVRLSIGTLTGVNPATPAAFSSTFCTFSSCLSNADCGGAAPLCDPTTRACVGCLASSDCSGTKPICSSNSCVACANHFGGAAPACLSAAAPACDVSGACTTCSTNAQCVSVNLPICSVGACLKCAGGNGAGTAADCPTAAPVCLPAGACTTCVNDKGGGGNECPTVGKPYCVGGQCNECKVDANCSNPNKPFCQSNVCVACNNSVPATTCAASKPVCTAGGSCATCDRDNGAAGTNACPTIAAPFCKGDGTCGTCSSTPDCTAADAGGKTRAGALCISGACTNTCTLDSQCGGLTSARICVGNACQTGCRGWGGNGCAGSDVCSSTTNVAGTCGAPTADAGTDAAVVADAGNDASLVQDDASTAGNDAGGTKDAGKTEPVDNGSSGGLEGGGLACSTAPVRGGTFAPLLLGLGLFGLSFGRRRRRI